jgi:parvulin-like peptidyl-prolyl isomerase
MIPVFEKTALALHPGAISQPVLSEFGYHIIKLVSRDPKKKSYRVRHILIPVELVGAHRDRVEARADSLDRLAAEQANATILDSVARKLGLPVAVAPPLVEGSRLQLGRFLIPDAGVWAFKARPGETSQVIETNQAYYVFRLDSLQPEGVPPYEKLKNEVRRAALRDQKLAAAQTVVEQMAKEIKAGVSLKTVAEKRKVPVTTFGPFIRSNPPIQIADAPSVIGAAFGLAVNQVGGPYETGSGFYFVEPTSKRLSDSTKFVGQLDTERMQVLQAARQDRVRQVLAALREDAKVTDRRKELEKTQRAAEDNSQATAPVLPRGRRF